MAINNNQVIANQDRTLINQQQRIGNLNNQINNQVNRQMPIQMQNMQNRVPQ